MAELEIDLAAIELAYTLAMGIALAERMKRGYEELRQIAEEVAGCDLAEWDYDDLHRYAELAR